MILPTSPTNAAERVISTGTSVVDKVLNAVNDASEKAIVTADRRTHQLVGSPGAQLARRVSRRSSQLFNEVGHTIGSAQGAVEQVAVVAQDVRRRQCCGADRAAAVQRLGPHRRDGPVRALPAARDRGRAVAQGLS